MTGSSIAPPGFYKDVAVRAARKLFAPQWRVDSVRRRVMWVRSGLEKKPVGPMFAVVAEIIGIPYDADVAIACPTTERFRSPEAIA